LIEHFFLVIDDGSNDITNVTLGGGRKYIIRAPLQQQLSKGGGVICQRAPKVAADLGRLAANDFLNRWWVPPMAANGYQRPPMATNECEGLPTSDNGCQWPPSTNGQKSEKFRECIFPPVGGVTRNP
jgi:hypothetical protein